MLTNLLQRNSVVGCHRLEPTQVSLNGHPAIHYCQGDSSTGSFYSENAELIFLLSGKLKIGCGKESFEMAANSLVLLSRNSWIEITSADGNAVDLEYIRFTITTDLVKEFTVMSDLPPSTRQNMSQVVVANAGHEWLPYVYSLEPILRQNSKPQSGLVKIKILELIFHLAGAHKCLFEHLLDIRDQYRTNITTTVEDCITKSLSIEQLAALSGRSLSAFRRDFMAIYHMPPSQWIRQKRLEKAKELLLSTTLTVTEICYTLGFEHIAHFSRLFKAHFGQPPSFYKFVACA